MRWLITGAEGFIGQHLVPAILESESASSVWALVWSGSPIEDRPRKQPKLHVRATDIRDAEDIEAKIREARPDFVLHLAAASSVAGSWQAPHEVYRTNVLGQLNLLEAVRRLDPAPRVVIASSCQIYDTPKDGEALREDAPFAPTSPYAVTKAAQDLQAVQYWKSYSLPTIRLRLFNHTGPGRPPNFVASSFARRIAEIEQGLAPPVIRVGNLEVSRDFSDVRDVVRAWRSAALTGESGAAYNVCSGRAVGIRTILDTLLELSSATVKIETDHELFRKGEITTLFGDPSAIREATGWTATTTLDETLADLLSWWRRRLRTGS